MVAATDYRWVRILAPLVYVASLVGLGLVLVMGATINGSRSWIVLAGMSIQPAEFAKLSVVIGMALVVAERTESSWRQREVRHVDVLGMLHAFVCAHDCLPGGPTSTIDRTISSAQEQSGCEG